MFDLTPEMYSIIETTLLCWLVLGMGGLALWLLPEKDLE